MNSTLSVSTMTGEPERSACLPVMAVPATADARGVVFVVDADAAARESLELIVESAGWQAETFASAQEFLGRSRPIEPSCLVMDVKLPDLSGLELQRRVAERTDMPIIFLSASADVAMTVQAMKAGAVEFLTKPFEEDVLLNALRGALERSRAAQREHSVMLTLRNRYASLSTRERQVLALVVSGLLNKQVAGELGISEITVKAHRGQVMRKMKADSLPALVHMVARVAGKTPDESATDATHHVAAAHEVAAV